MRKRKQYLLGVRIHYNGKSTKGCAHQDRQQADPEGANMLAERLRKGIEKPVKRPESVGLFTGLMDLTKGSSHKGFKIKPRVGLSGKSRNFSQIGRGPLIKIMKTFELPERQPGLRFIFQPVQNRLQFRPARALFVDEFLKIYNHNYKLTQMN